LLLNQNNTRPYSFGHIERRKRISLSDSISDSGDGYLGARGHFGAFEQSAEAKLSQQPALAASTETDISGAG
jgi:hypothetical protein